MLRNIHLYGRLADICETKTLRLDVETAGEAVFAICTNFKKAEAILRDDSWILVRGSPETGMSIDEETLNEFRLGDKDLHIMPEAIGAKNGNGALKAILGVALIAVSFGSAAFLSTAVSESLLGATTWGNVIGQAGLVMALSGVSQMLAPEEDSGSEDDDKSFVFSGPGGVTGQGYAVPVIYGEVITSGVLISAGLDAQDLSVVEDDGEINSGFF